MFPSIGKEILSLFDKYNKFLIVGHENPDGDCLGSEIGFSHLIKALNKEYILLNAGPFNREKHLEKMFFSEIEYKDTENSLLVVLDCSVSNRLGPIYECLDHLPTLIIDHHESGDKSFGDYKYIIPDSPSTTLLVVQFYKALGIDISNEAAKALFFGFATDTGFFKFLNEKQSCVLNDISLLLESGAVISDAYNEIFNQESKESKAYLASLLKKVEFFYNDRLAIVEDSFYLQRKYGKDNRDTDGLFAQILSIKTVEAVIFCKYINGKRNTFSLRSKNNTNIDVGKIAANFNGGGHFHASGLSLKGPSKTNINKVKKQFKPYFK